MSGFSQFAAIIKDIELVESRQKLLEYYCNTIADVIDSVSGDGGEACR